jgi:uncharacterized glyoxalase superfamily protein PhnB
MHSSQWEQKLLVDWELAAPNHSFEIRVRDVRQADLFYREVLGAREVFRRATDDGALLREGLAAGGIQFVVSSQDEEGREPALLSRVAAELGVPYLAVILRVDDPDSVALSAMQNGAVLKETLNFERAVVVTDPFGSHWALEGLVSENGRSKAQRQACARNSHSVVPERPHFSTKSCRSRKCD